MERKILIENAIDRIEANATDRQREAGLLFMRALEGDLKSRMKLQEGISTSDIPTVLQPSINVLFLAQYADYPTVWQEIAEEFTAPASAIGGGQIQWGGFDFDTSQLLGDHDGDTYVGMGLPGVGEYDEYPAISFAVENLAAELRKNGARLRVSWEALLNLGNFDMIRRATRAFAQYASEQEDVALAKEFVTTAGVSTAAFTNITGDPALTIPALEAAIAQGSNLTVDGRPLNPRSWRLVVPPSLSQTAANILSITRVEETDGAFTYDRATTFGNVNGTVFPALAAVGNYTTPGATNNFWYLVPQGTARPAFVEIFLEGYRTPLITVKDSGHMTLGGGVVPFREGNFEVDDVETRARHIVSAATVSPSIVLESDGTP